MAIITNPNGMVTVQGLEETAVIIRPELMTFPLTYQQNEFARMGVQLIPGIQNKLRQYELIRKGGLMRPYYPGMEVDPRAIGKMRENTLEVHLATGIHEDNIQNYKQNIIGPMTLLGTNKTYSHPLERQILFMMMATWSEDLLDIYFHGVRNPLGKNKYDLFDGVQVIINKAKVDGDVSESNRNYVPTGPLVNSANDTHEVFDAINNFLASAHPVLTRTGAILNVTQQVFNEYQLAIANKFKCTLTYDEFGLVKMQNYPNVRLYVNPAMGEGDLMILTKANIMQLGFDSISDDEYVKVRNIDKDANIVTFNIQARYGANVRSFDPKVFCVNDGTLTPVDWSGDMYNQDYTVAANVVANGTVAVSPIKDTYKSGEEVTLTVTPATGYVFDQWSNGVTTNPLTLKVMGDVNISATTKPQ